MPAQFPDTQIGDAVLAATAHQLHRSLRGYGWIDGGPATAGPDVAVTVPGDTTMWVDGAEVDVDAADNVANIVTHDRHPRWASIVVNTDGSVEAVMGEVNRPLEVGDEEVTGRQAPRPQPPVITDATQVLHSLVWVPANASAIDPDHIVDRRIDARVDAYNFTLTTYTDAEAVAAVEAESPLDLTGPVDIADTLEVDTQIGLDMGTNARWEMDVAGGDATLRARAENGDLGRVLIKQDSSEDVYMGVLDTASIGHAFVRAGGDDFIEADPGADATFIHSGSLEVPNGPIYDQDGRIASRSWAAPDAHDNTSHLEEFVSDGDGTTRQIWVIENGASDPTGAGADDIIFEKEA